MDIHTATKSYEAWLTRFGPLFATDLDHKHEEMRDEDDPFPFFRGTYYRWPHHWQTLSGDITGAPKVLAVGDLHVENFGLWRDRDGRLCWGVNDFDEADELPYTSDLVRLAASVRMARVDGRLDVKFKTACVAILDGYRAGLEKAEGDPFVLEERHQELRALALDADPPRKFWKKLDKAFGADWPTDIPQPTEEAAVSLRRDFPEDQEWEIRPRLEVGMGSLGKPRYMARLKVAGGWIAREVKRVTPPATAWYGATDTPSRLAKLSAAAKRSPDPFLRTGPHWVSRRLGPKAIKLELDDIATAADLDTILHSMGAEAANVHLGSPDAIDDVRAHLESLPGGWLRKAAKELADAVTDDWKEWRG